MATFEPLTDPSILAQLNAPAAPVAAPPPAWQPGICAAHVDFRCTRPGVLLKIAGEHLFKVHIPMPFLQGLEGRTWLSQKFDFLAG